MHGKQVGLQQGVEFLARPGIERREVEEDVGADGPGGDVEGGLVALVVGVSQEILTAIFGNDPDLLV